MRHTLTLSAAAALLFVAASAQAQRGQDDRRGRQDQRAQAAPAPQNAQRGGGRDWRADAPPQRGMDRGRQDQGAIVQERADQERANQARADQERANQARADQERANQARAAQQAEQWRDRQNQAQQQEQFERAQRAEQEEQLERERLPQVNRDHDRDYRPGYDYRYNVGGVYRFTNQYGVDVLRQAVDLGYEQGYRAGSIDRSEGAPADFQRAFDFENGNFGYTGVYVPESDYGFYFREGFQRGYDDGYWSRSQYGTFSNGKAAILGAVALGILGLTMVH